jgi:hypothetical protein
MPATAQSKQDLVARVEAIRADHRATVGQACKAVGISVQQYHRWRTGRGLGQNGQATEGKRLGRPAAIDLNGEEWDALHWLAIKIESTPLAVEEFLKLPVCRPETHAALSAYFDRQANSRKLINWPHCIRRACKVTAEESRRFRGDKHFADIVPVGHRRLVWTDETGRETALRAGDLYESDDMSGNQPFRYVDPETGREELGRQGLLSQDVYSLRWLGASPLGRPRDAYTAEDIADHLLAVVQSAGVPRFWRFERGPWENNVINGIPLDDLGPRFAGQRWGALDGLFHVVRAYGSRGKGGIESSFNLLQDLIAIEANGALDIGRVRGEFEDASKVVTRVNGLKDDTARAKALEKFWSIDQYAAALGESMARFSTRPKERREFAEQGLVVPVELWRETHPGKRELRAEDAWYFHPVKRIATVRQGQVRCKVERYPREFVFTVNGVPGAKADYLPHGLRVLIAFHPGHPERGCYVANAEVGSLNREHWHFAEPLVYEAPCWGLEAPAQIDLRAPADRDAATGQSKRRATAAVRGEFRSIRDNGIAAGAPAISTVRDGKGGALIAARNIDLTPTLSRLPQPDCARGLEPHTPPQAGRWQTGPNAPGARVCQPLSDPEAEARAEAEAEAMKMMGV